MRPSIPKERSAQLQILLGGSYPYRGGRRGYPPTLNELRESVQMAGAGCNSFFLNHLAQIQVHVPEGTHGLVNQGQRDLAGWLEIRAWGSLRRRLALGVKPFRGTACVLRATCPQATNTSRSHNLAYPLGEGLPNPRNRRNHSTVSLLHANSEYSSQSIGNRSISILRPRKGLL